MYQEAPESSFECPSAGRYNKLTNSDQYADNIVVVINKSTYRVLDTSSIANLKKKIEYCYCLYITEGGARLAKQVSYYFNNPSHSQTSSPCVGKFCSEYFDQLDRTSVNQKADFTNI